MSRYFITGGFFGFSILFFTSLSAGSSIHIALRNGMIGCLVMGLLVRYFAGVLFRAILEVKRRSLESAEGEERNGNHV